MNKVKTNSIHAWALAARPKTLAGAAVPVLLGCSLAYVNHCLQILPAVLCFLFAFLMQINANFINDLYDFLKGTDREDRLGPERACAQGWISPAAMKRGIALTSLISIGIGLGIWWYGGIWMLPIGVLCVLFAFFYTTGPYPLAYHGWGDLAVLVFFGIIPVGCTYYIMSGTYTTEVLVISIACGLIIDTLLMINNFRDREQDAMSRKRTLVVRFGEKAGIAMYAGLGIVGVVASVVCLWTSHHSLASLLPLLYLINHGITTKRMAKINRGRALNRILGMTSMNILYFGVLLSLAIILSGLFSQ